MTYFFKSLQIQKYTGALNLRYLHTSIFFPNSSFLLSSQVLASSLLKNTHREERETDTESTGVLYTVKKWFTVPQQPLNTWSCSSRLLPCKMFLKLIRMPISCHCEGHILETILLRFHECSLLVIYRGQYLTAEILDLWLLHKFFNHFFCSVFCLSVVLLIKQLKLHTFGQFFTALWPVMYLCSGLYLLQKKLLCWGVRATFSCRFKY